MSRFPCKFLDPRQSNSPSPRSSYMGKSTGAGGLAIWTHHLTDREWIPQYTSEAYSGPAVKVQAGVTGGVLVQDAEARGLAVVAGQCPVSLPLPLARRFSNVSTHQNTMKDRRIRRWLHTGWWSFCVKFSIWHGCRSDSGVRGYHD